MQRESFCLSSCESDIVFLFPVLTYIYETPALRGGFGALVPGSGGPAILGPVLAPAPVTLL